METKRAKYWKHRKGADATAKALQAIFMLHLTKIVQKGPDIYGSICFALGIDQDMMFEHFGLLASFVELDPRGGIVSQLDSTSALQAVLETMPEKRAQLYDHATMGMEHADDLCLDYELDNGVITGERCWSSLRVFENNQWTNLDMEFNASQDVQNMSLRCRLKGADSDDVVLIDRVTIEGRS